MKGQVLKFGDIVGILHPMGAEVFSGDPAGRPCPLQVIAAEQAGDIKHLADKKETRPLL